MPKNTNSVSPQKLTSLQILKQAEARTEKTSQTIARYRIVFNSIILFGLGAMLSSLFTAFLYATPLSFPLVLCTAIFTIALAIILIISYKEEELVRDKIIIAGRRRVRSTSEKS